MLLAGPINWKHHLGLLYHRNGAQDIFRDALGNESGSFEVSQTVLGLGYSYRFNDLSFGASFKTLNEVIEKQSASASVVDLGTLVEFNQDSLVLGAALQNIGSAPVLGSGGPGIAAPLLLRASANMRFNTDVSRWQVIGDYRYAFVSARSAFSLGVDYSEEYQDSRLGLRAGWDFSQSALGGSAGLALGAGYGYGPVGLDYAYTPREALGTQHRIALTLLWDLRAKNKAQDLATYTANDEATTPSPTATPAVKKYRNAFGSANAGAALDALLAATPSPTPEPNLLPTPVIEAKRPGGGILGSLARLFNFSGAPSEGGDAGEKPKGLLQSVFRFLGMGANSPTEAPEMPGPNNEDAIGNQVSPKPTPTALPMQRLKGDSQALPKTPEPVAPADKAKSWLKF